MNSTTSEYKQTAQAALSGRWPLAVLVSLIATLLGAGLNNSNSGNAASGSRWELNDGGSSFSGLAHTFPWLNGLFAFLSSIFVFLVIAAIILFIIGAAVELGHSLFYINLLNGKDVSVSTLFSRFDIIGKAFGLRIVMMIFIFLWSLLLFIPGIIAGYSYSMAPYLMAENPDMDIMEAINESRQLMKGQKLNLFILHLSFIGWMLVGALTLGIGFLFITPYFTATETAFYLELTRQNNFHGNGKDSFYYDGHIVNERDSF
ncbi:MAG: DUF975 family protein [Lachnospiraceae bacterium]|nr:DUF975 family protein [Lachnospiraceae bacterium]